jgi:DNA-binding GntR family transcriptional regulator
VSLAESGSLLDAYRLVNAPAMILSLTQQRMEQMGLDRDQAETAHDHMVELVSAYEAGDLETAKQAILSHDEQAREVAVSFMDEQGGSV